MTHRQDRVRNIIVTTQKVIVIVARLTASCVTDTFQIDLIQVG